MKNSGIKDCEGQTIRDKDLLLITEDAGDEGVYYLLAQVRYEYQGLKKSWQVIGEANYRMNLVEIDTDECRIIDRRFCEDTIDCARHTT